jgi:hypothetical protein
MPIGYLDVPTGLDLDGKRTLVKAIYDALSQVYPFPDDHRIFLREWAPDSFSQNGLLDSEQVRPVLVLHVPENGDLDARRTMAKELTAAVIAAYDPHPDVAIFLNEHALDTVAIHGGILADDVQRVADQASVYG